MTATPSSATPGGVLGLIPARGASKRLPGKNLRELGGRPLITWTIQAALAARRVTRVVVSTDDESIARVARAAGAEVPFLRAADLASDTTPTDAVVTDALARLFPGPGKGPDVLVILQPTSPLRTAADVDAALEVLLAGDHDAAVSVTRADPHPSWSHVLDGDGHLQPLLRPTGPMPSRSQDLAEVWALNGAIYAIRTEAFRRHGTLLPPRTVPYVMPGERSIDIDEEWQLRVADALLKNLESTP